MAMDYDLAVCIVSGQKLVANPHEIIRILFVQGHAGPNTSMDQDIVISPVHQFEIFEKREMSFWNTDAQFLANMFETCRRCQPARYMNPITEGSGIPADGKPIGSERSVIDKTKKRVLVVTLEMNDLKAPERVIQKQIDDRPTL